jgi:hypothetical protein
VASYVTAATLYIQDASQAPPPGYGGPIYQTSDSYLEISFSAGSVTNPTLKIVYDAELLRSVRAYVAGGGGGSFTASGNYGGTASLYLEISTTPGVWVQVLLLADIAPRPRHGGVGDSATVAKTIINYALSGLINTGTFKARFHVMTTTCTIYDEGYGGPGTWITSFCGDSSATVNIYSAYLLG